MTVNSERADILSGSGEKCIVRYGDQTCTFKTRKGKHYEVRFTPQGGIAKTTVTRQTTKQQ